MHIYFYAQVTGCGVAWHGIEWIEYNAQKGSDQSRNG